MKIRKTITLLLSGIMLLSLSACSNSLKAQGEYSQYIEICDLSKLKLQQINVITELSDEEKETAINEYIENLYEDKVLDKAIENGDEVLISYELEEAGDIIYATDEEYLIIGEGMFYKEIESSLIGKKAGDKIEVEVDSEESKDIYKISVLNVIQRTYLDLDDDLAKEKGFTSAEELKNNIYQKYIDYLNYMYSYESCMTAAETALDQTTFNGYPQKLYDETKSDLEELYEKFFNCSMSEMFQDDDQVDQIVTEYVNQTMFVDTICEIDKYNVSEEEIAEYKKLNFTDTTDSSTMTDDEIIEELKLLHAGKYILSKADTTIVEYEKYMENDNGSDNDIVYDEWTPES